MSEELTRKLEELKKRFRDEFVEFTADGSAYGAGLYIKSDKSGYPDIDGIEDFIEREFSTLISHERAEAVEEYKRMNGGARLSVSSDEEYLKKEETYLSSGKEGKV